MPIQPKLPTWDARQVIDHGDLNTLSRALGDVQQRFADNCPENAGQDFNPVLLDYFPAIVQADGGESSLTNPTDGKRVYLAAARPKESLNYEDAFDVEEESYPGIRPTDPFLATNMANLPDGGSMPPTNTPVICFHFWTRGVDGANSTDFYVFWWGGGGTPLIISTIVGAANYTVHVLSAATANVPSSGNLALADIGASGTTSGIGVDLNELGRTVAYNSTSQVVNGILLKTNSDGTRVYTFQKAPAIGVLFKCALSNTGGSNGSKTTAASFTYTATAINGQTLGTGLSPERARKNGTKTAATQGSGYFDGSGSFHLADAYEKTSTVGCS